MMELSINGERRESTASTVVELVEQELEGLPPRGIAVAVNGDMIPRTRWSEAVLKSGDRIEIVRALPGG